jgi:type II secretory ATPase GspE/PulE/Tfp pilus assembly ATPase PilB-like protein
MVLICAQRLIRRLCKECKEEYEPELDEKRLIGVHPDAQVTIFRAVGCEKCGHAGYKGRTGVHEMLVPNDEVRKLINQHGMTSEALKRQAVELCDMTTLYWDAMEKVRQGLTSIEDVLANIRKDEFDTRPNWIFKEFGLEKPANRDEMPF